MICNVKVLEMCVCGGGEYYGAKINWNMGNFYWSKRVSIDHVMYM